jgi:hypothetical protein
VLNTNNATIRKFLDTIEVTNFEEQVRFVGAVCALAKLLIEPNDLARQLELANKHFLSTFDFNPRELEPPKLTPRRSPLDHVQAQYYSLLAAARAVVSGYVDDEADAVWYLADELKSHPRAIDVVKLLEEFSVPPWREDYADESVLNEENNG